MSIWAARPVADVPAVTLQHWRVIKTDAGDMHFVGFRPERGTARVSSAIVEFDVRARVGVTRSGRRYLLDGAPGADADGDGEYVWSAWCQLNRVAGYHDVTNDIFVDS